jgi:hypothetical protein
LKWSVDYYFLNPCLLFQRRIFFWKQPIRNKNGLWRPCLLPDRDEMSNVYRGPSINASYQVSVQLAKQFQGRRFLEIDQSETRIACGSYIYVCLLTNRDEMSNHYSGSSIDASYQVSVHLVKWFQRRRFFRNRPIRNKNCLWRPSLLTNRDEMSNLYRGPSIHAFYQISVHSGKRFQRRRFFKNQPIWMRIIRKCLNWSIYGHRWINDSWSNRHYIYQNRPNIKRKKIVIIIGFDNDILIRNNWDNIYMYYK